MMRRAAVVLTIILMFLVPCASAQWQKQGVASGAVNDILRMEGSSSTEILWWLGTQGGAFTGRYATENLWQEASEGLYSPSVDRVDGYPITMVLQMKAILTDDGVYARQDGTDWVWADTAGLQDPLSGPFGYDTASDVAVAAGIGGTAMVYAGFDGHGVWKRNFCGTDWCPGAPIFSDDAEINRDYWTANTPWGLSICDKHTGVRSWKAGAVDDCGGVYASNLDAGLTLKGTTDLGPTAGHGYALHFWDRMATEPGWDHGYVEIATDAPDYLNWQILDKRSGYTDWTERIISLSAYTGPVKIRFRFTSDGMYEYEGWFVDDIAISRPSAWAQVMDEAIPPSPIPNPMVTALYIFDAGTTQTLYAATRNDYDQGYFGDIYALALGTGQWGTKGVIETDYLSLDGPAPSDTTRAGAFILAGTDGNGVHAAQPGGSFDKLCSVAPPAGRFIDVSVDRGDAPERTFAAATETAVYMLDPNCIAGPYFPYTRFNLRAASILSDCSNTGLAPARLLVGTVGTGLVELSCTARNLPPVFVGNEGQTGVTSAISMKNISQLALSAPNPASTAPPVIFAASGSDGMFKSRFPVSDQDYFVRYFYDPETGGSLPATAIALAPNYDDNGETLLGQQTIYLAIKFKGVYRSRDGGSSWIPLPGSPRGKALVDLKTGPNGLVAALTQDAAVWLSFDGGDTWDIADMAALGTSGNRGHALAVSPFFDIDGVIFAATEEGLFKRFTNIWDPVFTARPVLSVSLAPLFKDDPAAGGDRETTTVLIGTRWGGLFVSFSFGNFDFGPVVLPTTHAFLQYGDIPTIATHPASDIDATLDLYNCFTYKHRELGLLDGVYCMRFNIGDEEWKPVRVSAGSAELGDLRITDLKFHPNFQRTIPAKALLYASHQNKKVFRGVYQPAPDYTYQWTPSAGFFHTPPFIYSIAESPDLSGTVLAGTKGYGPMMSFDGGISFYPWPAVQKDGYVLHDIFSAAFTHGTGGFSRLLVSAGDPDYPTAIKDFGIFYQDYTSPAVPQSWARASLCLTACTSPASYSPFNFDGHPVLELRYLNLATDLLASDFNVGPLKSDPVDPYVPGALGEFWQVDASGTVPSSLSDISPLGSGSARALDPRALNGFVWGAQGTVSHGFARSGIPGAYRFNPNLTVAAWEQASGTTACALPAGKNWRAVLASDSSTALIGARDGSGVYRTDNADAAGSGAVCWQPSDTGMNPGDRDYDYTEYSKRVTAFVKVSNGILASLEADASFAGGVFFSDAASGGRAWVPVSASVTCPSSYELAGGSKIYTGTTCDGIYATSTVSYTGQPTALFLATPSTDPWHENRMTFTDHSAGNPASRSWNFGDGSAPAAGNPESHDYDLAFGYAMFTPILTSMGQMGATDTHMESVELVNTFITGIQKVEGQILVTWAEVSGGGHIYSYQLRKAGGADGGLNAPVAACVPSCAAGSCSCQFEESDETAFYKILTSW